MAASAPQAERVILERVTRGGRRLTYKLCVLQQPERARACGSGSKSHTDRRPVDPPPVVELCIFENLPTGEKDITFHYNANFFLFTTLEHARPIANGRVQNPQANTPPVLTGMPVSAMAYLDRPREAGYFLFPDLSVRHEGRYKLSFNLYEETREEQDLDMSDAENKGSSPVSPGASSFDWRMEIKSQGFNVFSAKKFPGLTESTSLSRNLSEQGCRVRIRRDVRMRKRPESGKPAEDEYARSRKSTPEPYRARSLSNASEHSVPHVDLQRRPSHHEYPLPAAYAPGQAAPSHLAFGNNIAKPAMVAPPYPGTHSAQAPPPMSPSTPYHPSSVQSSPYQTPQSQLYAHPRSGSQSYPSAPLPPSHDVHERRLSNPLPPASPQYPPNSRDSYPAGPSTLPRVTLPPPATAERKPECRLPSIDNLVNKDNAPIEVDTQPEWVPPATFIGAGSKRLHSEVAQISFQRTANRSREDGSQTDPHDKLSTHYYRTAEGSWQSRLGPAYAS